ncbi:hypothetical protein BDQ12DRAFT_163033 [Crucibulum laeve]|uniref:Uncharacterized protein n=1 Tax=Crucibulum laeve TaxID=68775 RepID=A0A5C3MEI9_9AGAR|nr:hypothetical protein BDQ12DRAFT_163033 [Crucibulum laeve]
MSEATLGIYMYLFQKILTLECSSRCRYEQYCTSVLQPSHPLACKYNEVAFVDFYQARKPSMNLVFRIDLLKFPLSLVISDYDVQALRLPPWHSLTYRAMNGHFD